ncbi:carbonic anhydrase [Bdellovibrio sp. HCB209]|uniref:carbonic anhydrase n=1 Tax=Bdellovibrio sp. HCB209 TaxID=3394354 RepID=UPI0039B3E4B5
MTQESLLTKKEILKMMVGFRRFRERFFKEEHHSVYDSLASAGQRPKTLMISCSDSRVDPAILFSSSPGEMFVVRNVANLVPPFESNMGFHGVSAAIEFAVVNLQVENVVILGHRQCGGIRSLFQPDAIREGGFVQQWMTIADEAKKEVLKTHPEGDLEQHCRECEKTSIVTSLKNLRSFPFIDSAIQNRGLQLIGVYFDLEHGQLSFYDDAANSFRELEISKVHP